MQVQIIHTVNLPDGTDVSRGTPGGNLIGEIAAAGANVAAATGNDTSSDTVRFLVPAAAQVDITIPASDLVSGLPGA